jgi:lactoylglutathione lyase
MPASYLSYVGIRVRDLERSLRFYTATLGMKEVARGDNTATGGGLYVLLQDPWSEQRLELNWYPPESRFGGPYVPGEALDHIAFRVADLPPFLEKLRRKGVEFTDGSADHELADGTRVVYVQDPDGNALEVYDRPGPIPSGPLEGY